MASMTPDVPQHDPRSPNGWSSQFLAVLWRTLFDDRWAPFVRLMVAAVVIVGLYLVIRAFR
jgi:hypothetical protein